MSYTFYEDEQRNIHFDEWDWVLDDHLDTLHALNHGVDPHLDWVWDDREYMTFWELLEHVHHRWAKGTRRMMQEFAQPLVEFTKKVTPTLRELWDKIATAAHEAVQWITDPACECPEHHEESLVPPNRVDARRVTHTSTKPPRPARIYRRRTP